MIPNLLVSIAGAPKSGKTHLALTFPDPIVVFSFDIRGAELLLPKFPGKNIEVKNFLPPIADSQAPGKESVDLWVKLRDEFRKLVEKTKVATIVFDPATMLWDIVRNAYEVERDKGKLLRRDYGEPNTRIAWMLTSPIVAGINVVSINYLKDVYVGDKATGEKEIDGFKRTEGLADLIILTEMRTTGSGKTRESVVVAHIGACRFDRNLNGEELLEPTYDDIVTLLGG